jgi:hypothetical protein
MKTLMLFALIFSPAAAFASSAGGSDGCGLGWEITKKKSFLGTTTRGTTNSFVPPTFGMTTGSIGCDRHSLAAADKGALELVATHYDALLLDMARGQGETVTALAHVLGCGGNSASFSAMTQENFESLTDGASVVELVRRLKSEAALRTDLQSCSG